MVYINTIYPLILQSTMGSSNLYPRARIFYSGCRYIDQNPKDLTHISGGMYTNYSFRPSMNGYYGIFYTVYSGSNHIVVGTNDGRSQETIFVEPSITTNLSTISSQVLHLQNELNFISSQIYWISSAAMDASTIALSSQSVHLKNELGYISSQVIPIHNDINGISSNSSLTKTISYNLSSQQIYPIHMDINKISSQVSITNYNYLMGISSNARLSRTELGNLSSQNIKQMHYDINFISSQIYWISSAMIDSSTLAGSSQSREIKDDTTKISSQLTSIEYKRIY